MTALEHAHATLLRLRARDVALARFGGLAEGLAGEALALDRLGRYFDVDVSDALVARVERALELCSVDGEDSGFLGGVVGVAWVLGSMPERIDAADLEDLFTSVDEVVCAGLEGPPVLGSYELAAGDAGRALYALRRLPRAAARHALHRCIVRLEAAAESACGGLAWRSSAEAYGPRHALPIDVPVHLIGRAHGAAGVIAPLAGMMRAGVEVEPARRLLAGAARFVMNACPPRATTPRFPFAVAAGTPCGVGRNAWCSGDPGVAEVLLLAGRALADDAIESHARDVALEAARAAVILPRDRTSLCCGAGARTILFARLAEQVADPILHAAMAHELEQLSISAAEDDSLFFGAAGEALARLASVTDPEWAFELT